MGVLNMPKREYTLTDTEIKLFYRLYFGMLTFANKKHGAVPSIKVLDPVKGVNPTDVQKIKTALWADSETVDEYLAQKDLAMPADERVIVEGWRKGFIHGRFIVIKQLANYAVFMRSSGNEQGLYGVIGLTTPIDKMFPKEALPLMTETTLLPFLGRVISDGVYIAYTVTFGVGLRKSFLEEYREIKNQYGITTNL
jgi:hypothetical protein